MTYTPEPNLTADFPLLSLIIFSPLVAAAVAVFIAQHMPARFTSAFAERLDRILANVEEIDKWELRRLLREEGIVVRLRPQEVVEDD